jgi:DNA polymerase III subunit beta
MNFSINSKEFLKGLNFAGRAVNPNATIPILQCVLLEAFSDGTLKFTGSDLNTTLITKTKMSEVDLDGAEMVKIAVPFDLLPKVLGSLPNAPVSITYIVDGLYGFKMELQHETSQFDIPCEDGSVYLKSPKMSASEPIRIPSQTLQRGIDQVVHCVSSDQMRPALCGIAITINEDSMEFACTDGFKMGIYKTAYSGSDEQMKIVLPSKFMQLISEYIGDIDQVIDLQISDRMVCVDMGDWSAYGMLIEEKYPDYKQALPVSFQSTATVNAEEFRTLLKRGKPFADPKENRVSLTFKNNLLFVRTSNPVLNTKSDQDMSIQSEIEELDIFFNMRFLEEGLKTISGDFEINMNRHCDPAMIIPDTSEGELLQYLVWPTIVLTEA